MAGLDVVRWTKRRYLDARILLRYRSLYPRIVRLADARFEVSVDPRDPRARKKIISDAIRRKRRANQLFWTAAVRDLQPQLAMDIGVNFGECLFQTEYPEDCRVLGIDGNPALLPYLEESRQRHPCADRIEVRNALVAERPGDPATFFVTTQASGGSTAAAEVARARGTAFREVTVPVTSVDAVLGIGPLPKTLVFKIDVEGYEGHVLRGMQRTLAAAATAVGFIEFDPDMLTRAGEDMGQLWDTLQSHFDVAMFRGRNVVDLSGATWAAAAAQVQQAGNHTDLLLLGGQDRSSARRWSQQRYSTTRRAA